MSKGFYKRTATKKQLENAEKKQLENAEKGWIASLRARKHKNGICEICRHRCKLQKDHDHETGKRRGNLCSRCDMGLGYFKDSLRRLSSAIQYLDKWKSKRLYSERK